MKEKLKIAILGMGGMGRAHADQLRKIPEVEIAALCTRSIEDAKEYNRQNNTDYPVFDDFDRMLETVSMDALYVCLPPYAHDGQIEKAAEKGIHILTEKPLALDLERGRSIAAAVKAAGVKSMMGYHMRFGGAVEKLLEMMKSGETGKPTLYSGHYACNSLHTPWWIDINKGGGQVLEQAIHLYDMAYYLMGEADSVSGYLANICHRDTPGYTVDDTSSVAIRFRSGALGMITSTNCAVPGEWRNSFKIIFEKMVVEFSDINSMKITKTSGEVSEETLTFDTDFRFAQNRKFVDVLLGKTPEFAPIREGLIGLEMVSAAISSSNNGGTSVKMT